MKFGQKQPKMAFLRFLVNIDPVTWDHKFRSKYRKNIPSSFFESLGSILSVLYIFIIFAFLFVTKTVFQPIWPSPESGGGLSETKNIPSVQPLKCVLVGLHVWSCRRSFRYHMITQHSGFKLLMSAVCLR